MMKKSRLLKQFLLGLSVGISFSGAYAQQQVIPLNACPNGGYVGPGQSCEGQTYKYLIPTWGAFAINTAANGGVGRANSTISQADANEKALKLCSSYGKCQVAMTFKNTCAAMAWGSSNIGRGTSDDAKEAEKRALAQCRQSGDQDCTVEIKGFCAGAKNW